MIPNNEPTFSLGIGLAVIILALLVTWKRGPKPAAIAQFVPPHGHGWCHRLRPWTRPRPTPLGCTVGTGWVRLRGFLLGFAILWMFPGLDYNFAVHLGLLALLSNPVLGGSFAWIGVYPPAITLKLALLSAYNG